MTRIKFIAWGIITSLFLHGCNEILQPVTLFANDQSNALKDVQEEFIDML